jgi:hypothetical protein
VRAYEINALRHRPLKGLHYPCLRASDIRYNAAFFQRTAYLRSHPRYQPDRRRYYYQVRAGNTLTRIKGAFIYCFAFQGLADRGLPSPDPGDRIRKFFLLQRGADGTAYQPYAYYRYLLKPKIYIMFFNLL